MELNRTHRSIVKSLDAKDQSVESGILIESLSPSSKSDPVPNFFWAVSICAVPLNVIGCSEFDQSLILVAPSDPLQCAKRTIESSVIKLEEDELDDFVGEEDELEDVTGELEELDRLESDELEDLRPELDDDSEDDSLDSLLLDRLDELSDVAEE